MNAEEEPEIIMSDLCADVEIDGHFLTVDIYKSDIDPGWILEVINEFGTSTVFDDPFLADGLAWQQFEKTGSVLNSVYLARPMRVSDVVTH